jgi:hypothetical protein
MSDLFHEILTTVAIDLLHARDRRRPLAYLSRAHQTVPAHARVLQRSVNITPHAREVNKLSLKILPTDSALASPAARTAALALGLSFSSDGRTRALGAPLHWVTGFSLLK